MLRLQAHGCTKKNVQFVRFFSEILHCILDLYEHFQLPGHTVFLQDTYVTLIDKTEPKAPAKREDYWIHTLKTKAPMRLNVEGGY